MSPITPSDQIRRSPHRLLLGALLVLALALTGCNSERNEPEAGPGEAQPAAGGGLVQGELANLPIPDAADVAAPAVEEDNRQTVSYEVTQTSSEALMDFYDERLPDLGWEQRDRTELPQGHRAEWSIQGFRLLIAAIEEQDVTTLSLQITDEG